ncbi:MAG: methylated-DNA--[protein]-cysteine S-methyltransferase [Bdellovibrio sp.]|nr:MAG: methylated-DNA--[protein]-cysteine S-methyltransferase [Bdellovibrio sp.]
MIVFPEVFYKSSLKTPLGVVEVFIGEKGQVFKIKWSSSKKTLFSLKRLPQAVAKTSKDLQWQLEEYFKGTRKTLEVPYLLRGTGFQIKAWKALKKIPYGSVISYKTQAKWLGSEKKAIAVGQANKRNPLPLLFPCHRVVGSKGLGGYHGGLWRKKYLLNLEKENS